MTPATPTNPAATNAPKAKAAKAPAKKAAPAKERPTAQRAAKGGEPKAHSEQGAPAPAPVKPAKPKPGASAKQDHEIPSAKEVANDAANLAHAQATGAAKTPKVAKPAKPRRMSALDAAAKVLAKSSKPMKTKDMIEAMASQGLWSSPGGKTPEATLYAAIIREISAKKHESRFKKHDRGLFVATGVEA